MRQISGEIQYLSDSLLIEKLCALEFGLTKQAGVLDMLGGVAGAIKDQVKSQVNPDSPGGIVGGLMNLMTPAVLFRLHPIVGILYLIGTSFGLDITSIFNKIVSVLKPKLEKGLPISPEEVNSLGKNVVASEVGPIEASASGLSNDLLNHLRTVDFSTLRVKRAQDISSLLSSLTGVPNTQRQTLPSKIPWFMGESEASPIQKIFGDLFATRSTGKAKWLLGGFVVWIVKTILAGAGLLAVSGVVSNYLGQKSKSSEPTQSETTPTQFKPETTNTSLEAAPPHSTSEVMSPSSSTTQATELAPSGRGEQVFPNDANHLWVIPLVSGSVPATLLAWTKDVYPGLQGRERAITQTSTFQKLTTLLEKNHRSSSPNSVAVPPPFTSRKQVVDLIIRDLS